MPRHRTALPPEIKELIALIRQGRLFEVQRWIADGKPIRLPAEGNFIISPTEAAMKIGFHSMVECLLEHLREEEDLDGLLHMAVRLGRLDLVELMHRFGANPSTITIEDAADTSNPLILRWFEDHGVDWFTDRPLASAFRWRKRAALGSYKRMRDKIPELQDQIDEALRYHAREGDLKWVSLLTWAGANPRSAPREEEEGSYYGSAIEAAAGRGHFAVLKRLKPTPSDDLDALLSVGSSSLEVITYLVELGANPASEKGAKAMRHFMMFLDWGADHRSFGKDWRRYLEMLVFLGSKGGRWTQEEGWTHARRPLWRLSPSDAIFCMAQLVDSGVFSQEVFKELVRTPKLKEILKDWSPGAKRLREFAGLKEPEAPQYRSSGGSSRGGGYKRSWWARKQE